MALLSLHEIKVANFGLSVILWCLAMQSIHFVSYVGSLKKSRSGATEIPFLDSNGSSQIQIL